MPMTSLFILTSGPPELPGLMAASVCMNDWNWRPPGRLRPLAETMPAVTVASRSNGLPMASTQSPTLILSESPRRAAVSGWSLGGSILITARSVSRSTPMILASCSTAVGSSKRCTRMRSALSTTWKLVMMYPLVFSTTPEPSERWRPPPGPPKGLGPWSSSGPCPWPWPPKKRSKKSWKGSSPPWSWPWGLGLRFRWRAVGFGLDSVLTFTTAGSIDFATWPNVLLSCCGVCMGGSSAASDELVLPLTPLRLSTVPIRMPTASVIMIASIESIRWARTRATKAAKREFILNLPPTSLSIINRTLKPTTGGFGCTGNAYGLDANSAFSVIQLLWEGGSFPQKSGSFRDKTPTNCRSSRRLLFRWPRGPIVNVLHVSQQFGNQYTAQNQHGAEPNSQSQPLFEHDKRGQPGEHRLHIEDQCGVRRRSKL